MTALDCWQCCHFVVALQFEPSLNKDFQRFPPQSIKIVPSKQILCRFLKFILSLIIIIYMIWFWSPLGHKSASLYSNLWAERAIVRGHQGSELRKVDGEKHKCSTFHTAPFCSQNSNRLNLILHNLIVHICRPRCSFPKEILISCHHLMGQDTAQ